MIATAIVSCLLCLPFDRPQQLEIAAPFGDGMVLQQGETTLLTGRGRPGEQVTLSFPGLAPLTGRVDDQGSWAIPIAPGPADATPRVLEVTSAGERISLEDVLVGEVWLCSGQSNMVWSVDGSEGASAFKAEGDRPQIRMFTVGNASEADPVDRASGRWVVCSPETVGGFSAVGYHFGRHLNESLGVPVGLVNASWGGSRVEAWMRPEALQASGPCGRSWQARWALALEALHGDTAPHAALEVDDSEWLRGTIPGHVRTFGIPDEVDGVFWHRLEVEVPEDWAGRPLAVSLGRIDDDDVTYFNGEEIGRTRGWRTPRRYVVPARLVRPGRSVIAVRCTDGAGPGGMHGEPAEFHISPVDAPDDRRSLAGPARLKQTSAAGDLPAQHRPSHLHNGMLHPFRNIPFAGVVWYQGENNAIDPGDPECYEALLGGMISDWRSTFDDPELPFFVVQLPNFRHAPTWNYARVRDAQRRVAAGDPRVDLVVTIDVGEADDIHPRNKHDVGHRAALLALDSVYGRRDAVPSGPVPVAARPVENGVAVDFRTFGSTLAALNGSGAISGVEAAGADGTFRPTTARISGDGTLVIATPPGLESPVHLVRYEWAGEPEPPAPGTGRLGNPEGLPASPFELELPIAMGQPRDRMLVFTRTTGFRHGSIPAGIDCFRGIADDLGLTMVATEDPALFNDRQLARCAVVVFLNTTGDVLGPDQETALERYVRGGGGWVGVHSAADTEYDWPFYGELVGAYFKTHPHIQPANIRIEDRDHPSTRMLPGLWRRTDEWYVYRMSPRPNVHVLASLDESSYTGGGMNGDHPIAWCHEVGPGRALYTGGGHTDESYTEPAFVAHLRGAVEWVSGADSKLPPSP